MALHAADAVMTFHVFAVSVAALGFDSELMELTRLLRASKLASPVLVPLDVPVCDPERAVTLPVACSVKPSSMVSVDPVAGAVIVTLLIVVAVATPRAGVTSVGDPSKTNLPVPVAPVEVTPSIV